MTIVCLSITTYRGITSGAVHYYGTLREYDVDNPERNDVHFRMTAEDAKRANKRFGYTGKSWGYSVGDRSSAFTSRKKLLEAAIPCAREAYGEDVEVYIGNVAMALEDMVRLV